MNSQLVPFDQLLAAKISDTFTDEEAQMYALSFKSYLDHDETTEHIIDFDNAWKWIGYGRKVEAKRLLVAKFEENKDYIEISCRTAHNSIVGRPSTKIMLTIDCFKDFCLRAETKQASKIRGYYIKLEKLFHSCHKEYLQTQMTQINSQLSASQDQISQLETKVQQLTISTPTYEEVEKTKTVYVLSTDVPGVYKVGKTKGPLKTRMSQLQTSQVNDIEIILEQKTHDDGILESCCHYVLDKYRSMSNREHFRCKKEYIVQVVSLLAHTLDTLKGTYQTIDRPKVIELLAMDPSLVIHDPLTSALTPAEQDLRTPIPKKKQAEKQSGIKGITWNKLSQAWQVRVNRKQIGQFKSLENAKKKLESTMVQ